MTVRCAAGDQVVAWLNKKGESQDWLAKELGVARSVLWRWLSGKRQPRINHIDAIEKLTKGVVKASAWVTPQADTKARTRAA